MHTGQCGTEENGRPIVCARVRASCEVERASCEVKPRCRSALPWRSSSDRPGSRAAPRAAPGDRAWAAKEEPQPRDAGARAFLEARAFPGARVDLEAEVRATDPRPAPRARARASPDRAVPPARRA